LGTVDVINLLQDRIDAAVHVTTARAAWQLAVKEDRQKDEETKKSVSAIRQTILLMYASKNDVLADFGLSPRRARRALSTVEKLEVSEKAKATRAARHTMGKRQKAAITGDAARSAIPDAGHDAVPAIGPPPAPSPTTAVTMDPPAPSPVPANTNGSPPPIAAGGA
jgi:hypothetical protein